VFRFIDAEKANFDVAVIAHPFGGLGVRTVAV